MTGEPPATKQAAIGRALRLTSAALAVLWGVQAAIIAVSLSGTDRLVQLLFALILALLGLGIARFSVPAGAVAVSVICGLAIVSLPATFSSTEFGLTTVWVSAGVIVPALAISDRWHARIHVAAATTTLVALLTAISLATQAPSGIALTASLSARTAAIAAVVLWGSQHLLAVARQSDDRIALLAQARLRTEAQRIQGAVLAQAKALLHDSVINTLESIRRCEPRDRGAVRRLCQTSTSEIAAFVEAPGSPVSDFRSAMSDLVKQQPLSASVTYNGDPDEFPIEVQEAMLRASREALANVRKHAGIGHARIDVSAAESLTVTVTDQGVGFDPSHVHHSGIRHSISDRLHTVGGEAEVKSTPGSGTEVSLHWTDPRREPGWLTGEQSELDRGVRGLARSAFMLVVAAGFVGAVGLLNDGFQLGQALAQVVALVITGIGVLIAIAGSQGVTRNWPALVPLIVAVPISTLLVNSQQLSCIQAGSMSRGWLFGVIGMFVVGVLSRNLIPLILAWFAYAAAMAWITSRDAEIYPDCVSLSALSYRAGVLVLLGMVSFRLLLNRTIKDADRTRDELTSQYLLQLTLRQRSELIERRLKRVLDMNTEFLRSIADGGLDPCQSDVQSSAAQRARHGRCILEMPDVGAPVDELLQMLCDATASSAATVRFGHFGKLDQPRTEELSALTAAVEALLAALPQDCTLTVSTPSDSTRAIRIVTDSPISQWSSSASRQISIENLGEQSMVTVEWATTQLENAGRHVEDH